VNFTCEEDKDTNNRVRQCALHRSRVGEDQLLRFVLDPDGRVVPDLKRKLPGRGVWITADYEAVAKAVRQRVFSRGFKQTVSADPDLPELVETLLGQAASQKLALANKAGCVVAGYAKVEKALKTARITALLHASDASADGCRKLDRLARTAARPGSERIESITCFSSAELSAALGKGNVNHAAIADDGAGRTFIASAHRYMSYISTNPAASSSRDAPEQEKA